MIHLDPPTSALLARLERFAADHDASAADRSQKMLNLERPTAELVFLLIASASRRRVLEIGTSNGYSAIWLANALRVSREDTLISIERDPAKAALARANLRAASLDTRVTVLEGDATALCESLAGYFDCVFFDADRVSAPAQLAALLPKLTDDALLLADNVLSHPGEIAGYLAAVDKTGQFDTLTVPVGKGLHIARRRHAL
ncbi:O-methyltransferase [Caballeronia humi]|uniref:O-methyltransferase n=1 Tax=Caballeronia humi TaxID=326474 RepID=A0A158IJS3_9BURK|nr:class I SAM-dependent methyltransferase [Caballeronia humi]SAL56808.1 O-methyltransferase [Caballeronia humi]